jgi:hypothetical protein
MSQNPIDSLIMLVEATESLDYAQYFIDTVRNYNPQDQLLQLQMDRQQASINSRRKLISDLMMEIRSRN